jgi:hypothetical protein
MLLSLDPAAKTHQYRTWQLYQWLQWTPANTEYHSYDSFSLALSLTLNYLTHSDNPKTPNTGRRYSSPCSFQKVFLHSYVRFWKSSMVPPRYFHLSTVYLEYLSSACFSPVRPTSLQLFQVWTPCAMFLKSKNMANKHTVQISCKFLAYNIFPP